MTRAELTRYADEMLADTLPPPPPDTLPISAKPFRVAHNLRRPLSDWLGYQEETGEPCPTSSH